MSKKDNKRIARRRALRLKHGINEHLASKDSIRAARRKYGTGAGK